MVLAASTNPNRRPSGPTGAPGRIVTSWIHERCALCGDAVESGQAWMANEMTAAGARRLRLSRREGAGTPGTLATVRDRQDQGAGGREKADPTVVEGARRTEARHRQPGVTSPRRVTTDGRVRAPVVGGHPTPRADQVLLPEPAVAVELADVFRPLSGSSTTNSASRSSSSRATWSAAHSAVPHDSPMRIPSRAVARRAVSIESRSLTRTMQSQMSGS